MAGERNTIVREKDERVSQLEEQIRELTFHLNTRKTISKSTSEQKQEIMDGKLLIPMDTDPTPAVPSPSAHNVRASAAEADSLSADAETKQKSRRRQKR